MTFAHYVIPYMWYLNLGSMGLESSIFVPSSKYMIIDLRIKPYEGCAVGHALSQCLTSLRMSKVRRFPLFGNGFYLLNTEGTIV